MVTTNDSDTHIGKAELDTLCLHITPGQNVRISAGILEGSEGTVVEQRTGGRVLVRLQKGLYLEVQQFCLETVKKIKRIKPSKKK